MPKLSPQQLLSSAAEAVAYVKRALPLGEANQPQKVFERGVINHVRVMVKVSEMREQIDRNMERKMIADDNWAISVNVMADAAIKNRCGNCGEQSAVAFVYLRRKQVSPIDWLAYRTHVLWNHAFLILGRPAEGGLNNLSTWVDGAVICDPYNGYAGPLQPVVAKYRLDQIITGKPLLRFECDPVTDTPALPVWKNY